jgi:hypothetical protein
MSAELFGDYPVLTYRNLDTNSEGVLIKAGLSCIYELYIYNTSTDTVYVKLYDKATAPDENDTPIRTLPLGALQGATTALNFGVKFTDGMGIRATTGVLDDDTTDPTTNAVIVNIGYR